MFRSPCCSKHCSSHYISLSAFFFPSTKSRLSLSLIPPHVCMRTPTMCLWGEEGVTKSLERTWQSPFSLSLHCFGPSQILFHGAKHALPGISQLPSPDAGLSPSLGTAAGHGEMACDVYQHHQRQRHTYYHCSEFMQLTRVQKY